jgi:amino acid transporter/nucleotide-binding universal stress UspA family protein
MEQREFKLSRGMGLTEATFIGVGAMIGAGIFVLAGIAAGAAGPALMLAFVLNGLIALTAAMSYAELGSAFPQAGGGYAWAKLALPGPFGFLAGWLSWFSHSVACSLYGLGFGAYFAELLRVLDMHIPGVSDALQAKLLAVLAIAVFAYVNFRGSAETGKTGNLITAAKLVILLIFAGSGIWVLRGMPAWLTHFTPFFPKGAPGLLTAMGITFVAFEGYEIIAQCGEEVRAPRRNIPKAIFLAVAIVVPLYVLISFVLLAAVTPPEGGPVWAYLGGKDAELAVLKAAEQFTPGGMVLLLIGGLFATTSALNATLYSSSRVSFAMGRDFNLPPLFARVHRARRTPHGAILGSAVGIAAMAVALPIKDVASATGITFMLLFAMVNISVVALRYQRPSATRGFRMPLHPWLPVASTLSLIFLAGYLFRFSATAWYVSAAWVGLGLIFFREYASRREREETGSRPLLEESSIAPIKNAVMVALANPATVEPLMRIASAVAHKRGTAVIALHVVQVPTQLPRSEGRAFLEKAEPLFEAAVNIGQRMGVPVYGSLRMASDVHRGVLEAVADKRPAVLVLGWRGRTRARERLFGTTLDPILAAAPTDVLLLRWKNKRAKLKRILVGVTASPHARLAVDVAQALAEALKSECKYLHVVKRGTPMDEATASAYLTEPKQDTPPLDLSVVQAASTTAGIVAASAEADLLVVGAARERLVSQVLFGEKPHAIARRARCAVLLTKRRLGASQSLVRRLFTRQE